MLIKLTNGKQSMYISEATHDSDGDSGREDEEGDV